MHYGAPFTYIHFPYFYIDRRGEESFAICEDMYNIYLIDRRNSIEIQYVLNVYGHKVGV